MWSIENAVGGVNNDVQADASVSTYRFVHLYIVAVVQRHDLRLGLGQDITSEAVVLLEDSGCSFPDLA